MAFWLWAGLYFTTPFLVFGIWWANRRRDVPGTRAELLIPVRVGRVIAVLSGLSVLTAVFLFLFPGRAAAIWPWTLTPLTAWVMGAISALGIAGLGAPAGRRWSSARVLLQVAALMLALILAAGARASGDLDPSNVMTWLIGSGFAAGHAGSANDPATCCREVLRGWHGWLEHPARTGRAASGHHNRRPFAPSYGRLTDVACGDPRSPRLPSRRRRLRLAERRRWRGPTPRDARSSG